MAKTFQFPLQKVLDLREHKEEQKSIELGKAKAEMNRVQNKLDNLNTKKNDFLDAECESLNTRTDLNSVRISAGYMHQLNTQIDQKNVSLKMKTKKVTQRREELLVAVKDKKIVKKLKERKQEEYHLDQRKYAAKRDDDVAIRIANQNRQN